MIGIYNIDNNLKSELSKHIEIYDMEDSSDFEKVDGLVIDWVESQDEKFIVQAAMVEHYARESIPIVIFDRFMCITPKEHGWLKKFNVSFLEPAINHRTDFEYLPQWSNMVTHGPDSLKFDLGYCANDLNRKVKLFEKYYRKVATLWPESTLTFYTKKRLDQTKEDEWREDGIYRSYNEEYDFKFTVLIDNPRNFEIGYLPDNLFKMMYYGVVPLYPSEGKYFHGLFKNLIVESPSDVMYYVKSFSNLRDVVITEIYDRMKNNYPEFTVEYACDRIKRKLMI